MGLQNKDILSRHELIAAGIFADCLAGVLGHSITKLTCPRYGGYQELEHLMDKNKIDLLLCFGNPSKTDAQFPAAATLIDAAIASDILMGCNEQTISILTVYLKAITTEQMSGNHTKIIADMRPNGLHPEVKAIMATA